MVNYYRSANVFIAQIKDDNRYDGIIITIEQNVKTIQRRISDSPLNQIYIHVFKETTKEVFEDAFLDAGDSIVKGSEAIQFITNV